MRSPIFGASAIALSLLALSACSSAPKAGETASPTPTGLPAVSLTTTCRLLFGGDYASGPAPRAADIILELAATPDGSTIDPEEVADVLESLQAVRETAAPELVPYIDATIGPIEILDGIFSGTEENQSLNFNDFKAAGLELLTRCTE